MPLAIACTNEEQVNVLCTPLTGPAPGFPGGRPAELQGALVITKQGDGDGSIIQDPATPMAFKAVSGELLADTVWLVEGDADLGDGVETISDTVTLTVTGARARNLGLQPGAVEPKAA